jgi:hypothetical protein
MREAFIEQALYKRILQLNGEIRKLQWIGRRGAPDRVVFLPHGGVFWVELKATGKIPDPHQDRELGRLTRMGQIVIVIDSLEAIDSYFPLST